MSIDIMKATLAAWATRNTDFFRPNYIPTGDQLVVIADDLGLVCYLAIVDRHRFDTGSRSHEKTIYNQILWAMVKWSTSWLRQPAVSDPVGSQALVSAGVKYAGATIADEASLRLRVGGGSAPAPDTVSMTVNPLFAGKGS